VGVLIVISLAFLVAMIVTSGPGGHHASAVELTVQVIVVVGAFVLVAGRVARG
jgi:hypothetical protein